MKHFAVTAAMLGMVGGFGGACAHRQQAQGFAAPPNTPAEDAVSPAPPRVNPAYGAAPGPVPPAPLQESAPPPPRPPAIEDVDHAVAGAIHRLLTEDEVLAPAAKNVKAKVYKGKVTLRGTVRSEAEREEIVQRISRLPGVDRVDDRLEPAGPH